mmetsp:Transcript_3298/g.6661  ORF Transcript_3298/g.6661 Transcript_3298/m.6661 type:complete len:128 (-) Transcript_3298:292-675(-)
MKRYIENSSYNTTSSCPCPRQNECSFHKVFAKNSSFTHCQDIGSATAQPDLIHSKLLQKAPPPMRSTSELTHQVPNTRLRLLEIALQFVEFPIPPANTVCFSPRRIGWYSPFSDATTGSSRRLEARQ